MKECIVHIGMHKTGSTSIQETLYNFQNDKFYYANLGISNHSIPIYCLFSQTPEKHHALIGLTKEEIIKKKNDIREKLIKSIEDAGNRLLLISGEDITLLSETELEEFKNFLKTEIKIIGYIRNPYEYISSAFQQILKARFINLNNLDKIYPNYRERFEKFYRIFGEEKILLKKFDPQRFPNGDVVLDFCQMLGIEISQDKIKRVNESFPKEIVSLLYIFRKYKNNISLNPPQLQFLGDSLKNLFNDLQLTKFKINSNLIKPIVYQNLYDIRWIEEKLGEPLINEESETNEGIKSEGDIMDVREDILERLIKYIDHPVKKNYQPKEIADIIYRCFKKFTVDASQRKTKVKIYYNTCEEIEFIKVDTLYIDLLNSGNLTIGGLLLLKKDIDGIYKLIAKINNEEKEVKWGLPSPGLAARFPDNPRAKNARFQITGVHLKDRSVKFVLNNKIVFEILL